MMDCLEPHVFPVPMQSETTEIRSLPLRDVEGVQTPTTAVQAKGNRRSNNLLTVTHLGGQKTSRRHREAGWRSLCRFGHREARFGSRLEIAPQPFRRISGSVFRKLGIAHELSCRTSESGFSGKFDNPSNRQSSSSAVKIGSEKQRPTFEQADADRDSMFDASRSTSPKTRSQQSFHTPAAVQPKTVPVPNLELSRVKKQTHEAEKQRSTSYRHSIKQHPSQHHPQHHPSQQHPSQQHLSQHPPSQQHQASASYIGTRKNDKDDFVQSYKHHEMMKANWYPHYPHPPTSSSTTKTSHPILNCDRCHKELLLCQACINNTRNHHRGGNPLTNPNTHPIQRGMQSSSHGNSKRPLQTVAVRTTNQQPTVLKNRDSSMSSVPFKTNYPAMTPSLMAYPNISQTRYMGGCPIIATSDSYATLVYPSYLSLT